MHNIARGKMSSRPLVYNSNGLHRFLEQELFATMIRLERKRTERSQRRFILMLLESGGLLKAQGKDDAFQKILHALSVSTRETDIKGWYKDKSILGVIFTEI